MMTIKEMKERKKELGYTNAIVSQKSRVPLGTVQKIFSGATANPRRDTMEALELVLKKPLSYEEMQEIEKNCAADYRYLKETSASYAAVSGNLEEGIVKHAKKYDAWSIVEPTDRWPRQGQYTVDDYYALPGDSQVELIDGVIYDLATPSMNHQRICFQLSLEFLRCIEQHEKPCEVSCLPFDFKLDRDEWTMVEPDVYIICETISGEDNHYNGAPVLAAEVLSASSREKDCTIKLRKYMNAGVREYWIVDPESRRVLVYVFEKDVLPTQYSFDDVIPIGISDGECSIDFAKISAKLDRG